MWDELKERLKDAAEHRDSYIEKVAQEAVDLIYENISDNLDNPPEGYLTIAKEDAVYVTYEYDGINRCGHPRVLDILRDRVQANLPSWIRVLECRECSRLSSTPHYEVRVRYEISKEVY